MMGLKRGVAAVVAAGITAAGAESLTLRKRVRDVALRGVPGELDGLTVMHISDVHAGYGPGLILLRRCVEWAAELEPDLIAVTGDLVARRRAVPGFAAAAAGLVAAARHGAFAVLGNHDLAHGNDPFAQGWEAGESRRADAARRLGGRTLAERPSRLDRRSLDRAHPARTRLRPRDPSRRERGSPHPPLPLSRRAPTAPLGLGAPRARRASPRRADLPAVAGRSRSASHIRARARSRRSRRATARSCTPPRAWARRSCRCACSRSRRSRSCGSARPEPPVS